MNSIYERLSGNDIKEIREMYINGKPISFIQKYYPNICEKSIRKVIADGGITMRPPTRKSYIRHEDFFEKIDSQEKAYILGLIVADGYIVYPNRKGRSPFWGITVQEKDS